MIPGQKSNIVSEKFWEAILSTADEVDFSFSKKADQTVISIANNPLNVLGVVETFIQLGTQSKHLKFLVVHNSHHDCLIGADLLVEATLDGSSGSFSWRGQTLKLLNRRQQLKSVQRVRLAKTKTLPPRSETICFASVPGSNLRGKEVVFEPCNVLDSKGDFHNCNYITVAASINAISRNGVFPVKILNTSQTSVRLQRNTKLGLVSEFDWIEASTNTETSKPKLVASVAAGMDDVALPEGVTISHR